MDAFFEAFASVLSVFYSWSHNYALSITMLTLLVMLVVTPLTLKGTRSMMVMQQLQPEMKKIQQRYKDDRQKLNEELFKFYGENNVNPMGGCLPLLVQAPIFLVLYQVLRGLTRRVSDLGFNIGWSTGQTGLGLSPGKVPNIDRPFDPSFLDKSSEMYRNLSGNTVMASPPFNIDLAESLGSAWSKGIVHALPFIILVVIVGVTGFIQQRQIQGRTPQSAQTNAQQQMIMKVMPVFLPVISINLPAGLVLYFAVSNLYRIGQQAFISRSIYSTVDQKNTSSSSKSESSKLGEVVDVESTPQKEAKKDRSKSSTLGEKEQSTKNAKASSKQEPKTSEPKKPAGKKPVANKAESQNKKSKGTQAGAAKRKREPAKPAPEQTLQPRARKNKKR